LATLVVRATARNACSRQSASVEIHLFGIPTPFAISLGLTAT